jgi:gamma-glutamylcyclotransferase (GGCT)/AIG2-like uncharacterized protein YtfP
MNSKKLFVYGTLKRGGELHAELASEKVRFLGPAKIQGRLFRISGESYPGAVPADNEQYIKGELYELHQPAETLRKIDEVEGCDEGLFERKLVNVWIGSKKMKAWAYFYSKPLKKSPPITSGHFLVKSRARIAQ